MAIITTSIAKEMELLREKEEVLAKAKLSVQEQQALQHYQQQLAQLNSPPQSMTMSSYSGLSYGSTLLAKQQALRNAYTSNGNYYVSGSGSSSPLATVSSSGSYTTTGTPVWDAYQTPYINKEDEWDAEQSQEAVSHGWMLVEDDDSDYPSLEAVSWGTKKHMDKKEILQDVLTMCLTGECPIAHKILHILSRNRSPYAEYVKTVEAMQGDYANK